MNKFTSIITRALLSRRIYIIFSVALIGYNVIGMHLLSSPGGDYWEHLTSMYSFSTNPSNPPNPYNLSEKPTHLFTPYHLFWGFLAKILNIHPFWLLPVIAGINMLLFAVSIYIFCRNILHDQRYALALALTMFFFWNNPWDWSGFYNFGLLPLTAIYPYWFVLPVSLLVIACYGKSQSLILNTLYGLLVSCVFLSHPLTGSFLILSLILKILLMKSSPVLKRLELLTIPLFSTVLVASFWPYFPVIKTVLVSGTFEKIGFAGNWQLFYQNAVQRLFPVLFGLPFLLYLLLKRKLTYVTTGLMATMSIYFFNYAVLHNSTLSRYVIFIAFFCHIGIILNLKHFERYVLYKYAVSGFLFLTLFLAFPQLKSSAARIGQVRDVTSGKPIGTHSNVHTFRKYSPLGQYIEYSDVVMAPMEVSWKLPGIIGCKVVGVIHSNPFMQDFFERKRDTEKFFTEHISTSERSHILSTYSVNYVLVPNDQKDIVAGFKSHLNLVYKDKEYALYTVK